MMVEFKPFYFQTWFIASLLVLYLALISMVSWHPRGTDQYWSLSTVDRVIHYDGKFKTNYIYPAGMPSSYDELPRPWIQNRPVVYLVSAIAFIVRNPQMAWIFANFLFLVLTAALLNKVLRDNGINDPLRFFSLALLILFPLNFYLVMQALPEQFNQLMVMLVFLMLYQLRDNYGWLLLTALVSGMLIYQRDNYVLLGILVPFYIMVFGEKRTRLPMAIIYMAIIAGMYSMKPLLFPSHTIEPLSAIDIITQVVPGKHNMVNYLYTDFPRLPAGQILQVLWTKAIHALKAQFLIRDTGGFFMYSLNLMIIPFIILVTQYRKHPVRVKKIIWLTGIVFFIQMMTTFLFENQYRFSAVLIPLLLLCMAVWLKDAKFYLEKSYLIPTALVLVMLLNAPIAYANYRESMADKAKLTAFGKLRDEHTEGKNLLVEFGSGKSFFISYVMMPAYCYYFPTDAEPSSLLETANVLHTNKVMIKRNSALYGFFKERAVEENSIQGEKQYVLLTINTNRE